MPKVAKKKFRAQYKEFGLTYSKCKLTRLEVVDGLKKIQDDIVDIYCAQETHDPEKEGYDPNFPHHIHVWFNLAHKPNIRNADHFDIDGYHPNIGKKNRSWVYNYLKKQDKNPVTNFLTGFIELARGGQYDEALKKFQLDHPKDYVINSLRIEATLRRLARPERKAHVYPLASEFEIDGYDWESKSLFITGPPDLGKTEWVKSYITHKLEKTFHFVSSLDGLKRYNGEDFIIIDEWSPREIGREMCINLCDVANPRDIKTRHCDTHIPAGVVRVFTSNLTAKEYFPRDDYGAILPKRVFELSPSIRFY